MKIPKTYHTILLASLITFPFVLSAAPKGPYGQSSKISSRWHKAMIAVILNNTAHPVVISNQKVNEEARPGAIRLKNKFIIPFISMKPYLKHILKDIPYVPHGALQVKHANAETVGLWEDERGIQACKVARDVLREEGVENLLGAACLEVAQALTLKVNAGGYQLITK